jgi:hypothetical protein
MRVWLATNGTAAEQRLGARLSLLLEPSVRLASEQNAIDLIAEGPWLFEPGWRIMAIEKAVLHAFGGCISPLALVTALVWVVLMAWSASMLVGVISIGVGVVLVGIGPIGVGVLIVGIGPWIKYFRYHQLRAGPIPKPG